MAIKIYTDSCCDLPYQFVEQYTGTLKVIGIPVQLDGTEYIDDLGRTFSHDEFYAKLRAQIMPNTAQINSFMFESEFEEDVKAGHDVIYLGFSSGLSGTYNSSRMAKESLLEKYPNAFIEVVDTLSASVGLASIIVEVLEMIKEGKNSSEIVKWVESNKLNINHWFGVDNLTFLKNGGRISSTTAIVGNVLNVKPTLVVNKEGVIKSHSNVRGRKKSMAFLVSKIEEHIIDPSNTTIVLGHGNTPDDAEKLKAMILEKVNPKNIIVSQLSMTIASHVGPDMIAVAFVGSEREL